MAGRGLGTLTLSLIAKIGGFTGPLDKAGRDADKRMREIEKNAKRFGVAFGAAIVAGATAAGYAVKAAIDEMDKLSKAAQKMGLPTESLSRLAYAANLSDVSLEQLQSGLGKLVKYQAEAAQGGAEAAKTFAAFGIAVKDASGNLRGTEAVLQDFARVFASLPDGPTKTALALRVFGKSGAELIPLLNSGADGLADMAREADALGVTISGVAGKNAEEFNDNLTRLKATFNGLANDVATLLLPELIKLSAELGNFAKQGREGGGVAAYLARDLSELSKSARQVALEVEYLKKAWNDQGFFGEGIFSVLRRAKEDFDARERMRDQLLEGRGAIGGGGNPRGRGVQTGRAAGKLDAINRNAAEQARRLLATDTSGTDANSAAKRALAEAAREAARAQEELNRKFEEAERASADFKRQSEDLTAQLGGPLAESALRYRREEEALRDLWARGSTPVAGELEEALTKLRAARDADAAAIRKSLDTGEAQLQQMRDELGLLREQTQAARDRAAFLLDNPTATGAQADEAASLRAQIDATREAIAAADELRGSFADAFASVLEGSKSAKDAFTDLANSIISQMARMLAQNWAEQLFGSFGTTGAGSSGGGLLSLLSGFLGGARADGGPVSANVPYLVGERGPEIMVPRAAGAVVPNHKIGGQIVSNVSITVPGNTTRETADQIAQRVALATQRAVARTG